MLISEATYLVLDCETTGLDPATDRIVEIAAVATTATEVLGMWSTLVDGRPVTADNSAIHGLTNLDLIGAPDWPTALNGLSLFWARFGTLVPPVAHNAKFDRAFVMPHGSDKDWLCTKRLAQHLYSDLPGYSNQTLRYRFAEIEAEFSADLRPYVETFGIAAHRALGDALVTARNLRWMLAPESPVHEGATTVEGLLAYANSPILYQRWPFGKYRNEPVDSAPASYIGWAIANACADDPDLKFTLEAHLNQGRML